MTVVPGFFLFMPRVPWRAAGRVVPPGRTYAVDVDLNSIVYEDIVRLKRELDRVVAVA